MLSRRELLYTSLGILIVVGYMYSLDWPQTLETPLREQPYNFSTMQFNMLYLTCTLPIGLLNIPIGILLDKTPLAVGLIIIPMIGFLTQLGMALCFLKLFGGFYAVLLVLRGFFGISGEGAFTMQAMIIQKIGGKNYDMMMGLCLTVPLFFDAVNSLVSTSVFDATQDAAIPLFICAGMTLVSVISGFVLIYFTKKHKKQKIQQGQIEPAHEEFSCKDFKNFNYNFWLIVLLTFVVECSLGPFLDNLNDLLVKRFHFQYTTAGKLLMIPFGLTPPLSLVWSQLSNKYPQHRRIYFISIGLISLILNVLMFVLPNTDSPSAAHYVISVICLLLLSLAFAGFCTLIIPSVSLIVPEQAMGTAFGASGSATALSQAIMPILNALIIGEGDEQQLAKNYHRLSLLYLGFAVASVALAVVMRLLNNDTMRAVDKLEKNDELFDKLSSSSRSFSGFQEDITIHLQNDKIN